MDRSETKTFKIVIAYNGAGFKGWQRGNGRTVQSTLEEAIGLALGRASQGVVRDREPVSVDGAGRTDAGVHATGQVASAVLPSFVDPVLLLEAVNRLLPDDVAVRSIEETDDRFHARYRATAKTYRYRVVDGPVGNPFLRQFSWRVPQTLDIDRMQAAAQAFIGENDFSAFTAIKGKKSKVRIIHSIGFERVDAFGGSPLDISIRGNGFLWNQVRIMVCALVEAGKGDADAHSITRILESGDRSLAPEPAPARGLTLVSVEYAG